MKICPACRQKQQSPDSATSHPNLAELEYCSDCKVVWLNFGAQRPRLYERVEAQIRHWEAGLARRSS